MVFIEFSHYGTFQWLDRSWDIDSKIVKSGKFQLVINEGGSIQQVVIFEDLLIVFKTSLMYIFSSSKSRVTNTQRIEIPRGFKKGTVYDFRGSLLFQCGKEVFQYKLGKSRIVPFTMNCPYCSSPVKLVSSKVVSSRNSSVAYICSNFPSCNAYVGCHKDTIIPLGFPANPELRRLRASVHSLLDSQWVVSKNPKKEKGLAYTEMAEALGISTGSCHVAQFDVDMCNKALTYLESLGRIPFVVAVDFDGTISPGGYPIPDRPPQSACKEVLRRLSEAGVYIVLWTCRTGDDLIRAKLYLQDHDLIQYFSGFNSPCPYVRYRQSEKIFANVYIDDLGINGIPKWETILEEVKTGYIGGKKYVSQKL